MAGDELTRRGWHLTAEGRDQCIENGNRSADTIIKNALNLDLKEIGDKWLPADVSTGRVKVDYVEGPGVLQVQKLRNISAPKDNEESQTASRLWKITLTDGHSSAVAVCLEPLKNLSLVTPPGTKLLLEGTVDVESSYLLLTNKNARLLGGRVANLVESWELKRKLAQQSRAGIQSEGGPPPFVPFGKKIASVEAPRKDNFRSLAVSKQTKEEEDSEFQQQRQATIAEALTAKTKTFGGGQKPQVSDQDLARIVEMGFTADQAANALRQNGNNVNEAISSLLGGGRDRDGFFGRGGSRGGGRGGGGPRDRGVGDGDREDSRRGGRGGRGGRRGRGADREEEEDPMSVRPSGPATLFDFLETKIPSKSETSNGGRSVNQRTLSSTAVFNPRPNTAEAVDSRGLTTRGPLPSAGQQQSKSQPTIRNRDREKRDTAEPSNNGYPSVSSVYGLAASDLSGSRGRLLAEHGNSLGSSRDTTPRGGAGMLQVEDSNPARRQQNLPPRLANKLSPDSPGLGQNLESSARKQDGGNDSRVGRNGSSVSHSGSHTHRRPLHEQNSGGKDTGGSGEGQMGQNLTDFQQQNSGKTQLEGSNFQRQRNEQQHQRQGRPHDGPYGPVWHRGQSVYAKYWEDDQYYQAVVEAVAANGATVVVTFLGYGNQEEVLSSHIQLYPPQQNWNKSYPPPHAQTGGGPMMSGPAFFPSSFGPLGMSAPPPLQGPDSFQAGPIPNMEFRRSGGRRPETDRRRPTQNIYVPPTRKKEG